MQLTTKIIFTSL